MTKQKKEVSVTVKRDYKSRLFAMIFSGKKELLELYNAVSGNRYTDPEELTITTLENAIYMSMKNDVSFIIGMRLSESYEIREEPVWLELVAEMININKGHNKELMASCKTLQDYAEYIYRVRKYAEEVGIEEAVERAIKECIEEDILREFLERNRAEAKAVSIYEYNEAEHMRMEREDYYSSGYEDGCKVGHEQGLIQGHQEGRRLGHEQMLRKYDLV